MDHSTGGRPTSTPSTMDYTTQGDLNQVTLPVYTNTAQATAQNQFFCTNNFFVPDGSNRHIHEIRDKVFHARYLENGNNTYLLELLGLKDMLHTMMTLTMTSSSSPNCMTPPPSLRESLVRQTSPYKQTRKC